MNRLSIETTKSIEAIDVTDRLTDRTWPDGWLLLSVPHTTAALVLGESDPDMLADYERVAGELFAPFEPFRHHRNDNPNAAAHLVSSIAGTQLVLPVRDGRLVLGTFQRVVLIELDGPKTRMLDLGSMPAQSLEA